jgi:hypothetical protein
MMLSPERLLSLFDVDVENGRLIWRNPPKYHPRMLGKEAGGPRPNRGKHYWVVKIDGRAHKRGRLIFLAAHGKLPNPCVDHINGDSLDDRISNLREATVTQNAWNHSKRARRINLPMGVRRVEKSGRFQARISFHGRQIHHGAFDTPEEAHGAYLSKRRELYREFA